MLLSDEQINECIKTKELIKNAKKENIRNCAYTLRIGQLIEPETGAFIINHGGISSARKGHTVKPNEVIIVMTAETIKMPDDLCATYSPLYRLSRKGMMLLNPSVIEPGYQGPLSCIFLNFGSLNVRLIQDDEIAKITFYKLAEKPKNLIREEITKEDYESNLANYATSYKKTFLDIENIKDRTVKEVERKAKSFAIIGGVVVSIIILWSAIQPFVQKSIYKTSGIIEKSQRLQETSMLKDIEKDLLGLRKDFKRHLEVQDIKKLQDEISQLKAIINHFENK